MRERCLMCGGVGGDEPPASALPFGLRPGSPFTVHFTPTFSADSSLAASPPAYEFCLRASETAMRLAQALDECYSECIKNDGACPACFLLRVSLRLEGEGWEISQEIKDHAESCVHNGPTKVQPLRSDPQ